MKLKAFEVLISNAKETSVNLVLSIKINKNLKLYTAFWWVTFKTGLILCTDMIKEAEF